MVFFFVRIYFSKKYKLKLVVIIVFFRGGIINFVISFVLYLYYDLLISVMKIK